MERKVKTKSVVPVYAFAAVWVIYCLFFPLYKLWHFAVVLAFALPVYALMSRLFPGRTVTITVEEPKTTGNPELDAIISEGALALDEMRRLQASIKNGEVKRKIDSLIDISDKIVQNVIHHPENYPQVKKFLNYYLPTTIKLLNAYDRMYDQGITGENITGTIARIEDILDTIVTAYEKQLDSLFANQALDIETDIQVLDGMLKREGLIGGEFRSGGAQEI